MIIKQRPGLKQKQTWRDKQSKYQGDDHAKMKKKQNY